MIVLDEPVLTRSTHVADMHYSNGVLEALFVPWDETTMVYGDPDRPTPYAEGFKRGAFDLQLDQHPKSVQNVTLLPGHGSSEHYGRTRSLTRTDKGLHGVVSVMSSHREDVEQLVEMGVDAVSIEFVPLHKPRVSNAGVVWRTSGVLLQAVALTPTPAYGSARVLALREQAAAAQADAERAARMAQLDADLEAMRAGGARWH